MRGVIECVAEQANDGLRFTLDFAQMSFLLYDVVIYRTPARKTEGAFQMRARTRDRQAVALASEAMLGPNAEFGDVRVMTEAVIDGKQTRVCLHTNLTSSMESSSFVEINLSIVGAS